MNQQRKSSSTPLLTDEQADVLVRFAERMRARGAIRIKLGSFEADLMPEAAPVRETAGSAKRESSEEEVFMGLRGNV